MYTMYIMIGAIAALLVSAFAMVHFVVGKLGKDTRGTVTRVIACVMVIGVAVLIEIAWFTAGQPLLSSHLAVQQLNGGNAASAELRFFEACKNGVHVAAAGMMLMGILIGVGSVLWKIVRRCRLILVLLLTGAALGTTGCMRRFDTPEYSEINTSETAFLIPLEGEGLDQARFQSEEYLRARKVAAKRVRITHRWSQEGRLPYDGHWIPTVRLVKVDRSPVTREWTAETSTGTSQKNEAIWIESADSVGFSMGFTCTAFISEENAAKFLYWYPTGSLATMMDREVRGRIQQVAAEVSAKYPLDLLRTKKQEIVDAVRLDLTNFFNARGITITTVGMFGGMTYLNPEIQKAIDATFIAQQAKVINLARLEAQQKENERVTLEANATAERARREATGQADAKKIIAAGEAQAIREVSHALTDGPQMPLLYQLKALDVEKFRVEKWSGNYPTYYMGTGSPNLLFQVPSPALEKK